MVFGGWSFLWDARCRTPRATHPDSDAEVRLGGCPPLPSLFGFAPGGVYHAAPVARGAVRSYRTLSPLPEPWNLKDSNAPAVCSLWHFPWGRPRRTLSGTVLPWSPDFPPPRGFPHCAGATIQPSGLGVLGVSVRECKIGFGGKPDQGAQSCHALAIHPFAQAFGGPMALKSGQGAFQAIFARIFP